MRELILFSIDKNNFAIELDKIKRIVQAEITTPVAGSAEEIEGVFTFENDVIKVLNFRKMINLPAHGSELQELFPRLKQSHIDWVNALEDSVVNDTPFTKALSPYDCELGKWMGSFNSYDSTISMIMDKLFTKHAHFHGHASTILREAQQNKEKALEMIREKVKPLESELKELLDSLLENVNLITNSMQKFLILDGEILFAVRIDDIDDIVSIEETDLQTSNDIEDDSDIKFDGIFEYKDLLVNLIQSINLPTARSI